MRGTFLTAICAVLLLTGCAEHVRFRSAPDGAKIFVNDDFTGVTPMHYQIERAKVGTPITYRIEKEAYQPVEGQLRTRLAGGRLAGAIFTLGIVYIFRSPFYYPGVDVQLTPVASPLPPPDKATPSQRLMELERMYRDGLIKEQEYHRLREQILRDL
jgi:hypothetical protein